MQPRLIDSRAATAIAGRRSLIGRAVATMSVTLGLMALLLPTTAPPAGASGSGWGTTAAGSRGDKHPGDPSFLTAFQVNGGYVAAGVGLRNLGYGTISISGIPSGSSVAGAYLFWDELAATSLNLAQGVFNGRTITGTALGSDVSPCWPAPNNYGYVADVTNLVSGNGSYSISGFASGVTNGQDPWNSGSPAPEAEGASLVIVYQNAASPLTTVQLYGGASETQSAVINQSLTGFGTVGSPVSATTTFIVADGQSAADGGATFNGTALTGSEFQGSDPLAVPNYSMGNLWDTETFNVSSLISAGATSASATIQGGPDCLVWVGQVLAVNSTAPGSTLPGVGIGAGGSSRYNPTCNSSRPVNCASGDFWHTFTDVAIPGRGPSLDLTRTYNSLSASKEGIFGFGWQSSYDQNLVVNGDSTVTITEADGSQVTAVPSGSAYVLPGWADSTLTHNSDGTWTFVRQRTRTLAFSSSGQLTSISDPNGYMTTLAYSGGKLQTVTDQAGRTLSFAYGTNGLVTSVTDPGTRVASYGYDSSGDLTSVTDPNSGITSFGYASGHLLGTMTDPRNGTVTNVYDSQGRVTSQTDPMNRRTTWAYTGSAFSPSGGTTTITDPNGNITAESYTNGELTALTAGSGTSSSATWRYGYDPATLGTVAVTDPNGHLSRATYDSDGNLLSETGPPTVASPTGAQTTDTYNGFDEPLTATDPNGTVTTYTYDSHGNLTRVSEPLTGTNQSQVTTYSYGDSSHPGDVSSLTDPDNQTWLFSYDTYGDLGSKTDPLGNKTTYAYNALGQKTSMVTAKGNVTGGNPAAYTISYTYDPLGDLTQTTDPLGHLSKSTYDGDRNTTSTTDADGSQTTNTYDADNELTKVTRADSTTLQYSYDADGNQTGQTDGKNNTTAYGFDPLNRVTSVTDPLNRKTSYTYDAAGNRATLVDPAGQTTTWTYDAANEVIGVTYSDGKTPNVTNIAYSPDGQETSMTDGTGTSSWAYDSLNRLTSYTNGAGSKVSYGYDLKGQETSITYPGSTGTVTRTYDAAGNLMSVTDPSNNTTSFGYDPNTNNTTDTFPTATGVLDTYAYNAADQLTGITDTKSGTTFASFSYGRDNNAQENSVTSTGVPADNHSFGYDQLNRLTTVDTSTYNYDNADNLTKLLSGITQNFDAAHELTSTTNRTFSYDSRGNRTSASGATSGSVLASDTFHRPNQTYWGTASNGRTWAGDANSNSSFSISGNAGLVSNTGGNSYSAVLGPTATDAEVYATGSMSSYSNSNFGDVLRWTDGNNWYKAYIDGSNLIIQKKVSGTTTILATKSFVATAGTSYSIHFRVVGSTLTANVWASSGTEPAGWMLSATDTSFTSGYTGMRFLAQTGITATVTSFQSDIPGGSGGTPTTYTYDQANRLTGVTSSSSLQTLAAGDSHGLAVKADGTAWAWGLNSYGQLGNNSTTNSTVPVQVSGLTAAVGVAGGTAHSVAVKSDGTVWDWGRGSDGQLGNNTTSDSHVPVQVSGMSGAVGVAARADTSIAVKSDGTVWGWGSDAQGQLGNNSTTDSSVPVQASGITGVVAVAEGYRFTLAVKSDGTVWTWGANGSGQLGNNTTTDSHVPVQVSGLSGVIAVAAGDTHSLALKSDGTVWAWGGNTDGQLGNNSTTNSSVPIQVPGLSGFVALAAGHDDSLAVKSDGTAWAWGANGNGQLGNNSTTSSLVPIQVNNITSVGSMAGGQQFALALKSDGTVWAWGANGNGQLGNNSTAEQHLPVQSNMNSVSTSGASNTGATYTYNGDGLRMSKTVNGATSQFTWDTAGSTPLLISDGTNSYIYGPSNLPVEEITPSGTYYYHHDQLGSTRVLTDSSGHVANTYTYDPYGNTTATTGTVSNPLTYAGEYTDSETGLLYLINRYYDPSTAQFFSADPASAITQQKYQYANDNPLNKVDPSGLAPLPPFSDWCIATASNVNVTPGQLVSGAGTVACVEPLDFLELTVEIQARGGQFVGWTTINETVRYYDAEDILALAARGQVPNAEVVANPPIAGVPFDYRVVVKVEAEKWGDTRTVTVKGRVRRGLCLE